MFGFARKVSVIVAPHGSSRNWSRDLSFPVLLGIGVAALVLCLLFLFLLIQVVDLSAKSRQMSQVREENEGLREQVARVDDLEAEISELREFETRIRQWAGIDRMQTWRPRAGVAGRRRWEREETLLSELPTVPPVSGWVSRRFERGPEGHPGLDFVGETGTPVAAAALGVVRRAEWDDMFGNLVILDHGNGFTSWYGHNDAILVNPGDLVPRGQVIARLGNTGRSSAPHVHFEIRLEEEPLDPAFLLSSTGESGGA